MNEPADLRDVPLRSLKETPLSGLLRQGVALRNSGDILAAEMVLTSSIREHPTAWQAWYELGLLHYQRNDVELAFHMVRKSFGLNPSRVATIDLLFALLSVRGNASEIRSAIEGFIAKDYEHLNSIRSGVQHCEYLQRFPLRRVEAEYAELSARNGELLSATEVVAALRRAKEHRKGFALLRLGDGEGSWLFHDPNEEIEFGALYDRNRRQFWNIWFGQDRIDHLSSFYSTARALAGELANADIVGIPPLSWTSHEYSTGSIRGCAGTFNAVRIVGRIRAANPRICTQLIHYELGESKDFMAFLKSCDRIGVFSCHPGIEEFVTRKLDGPVVEFVGIPGEPSRKNLLGGDSISGVHFPTRYGEILAEIDARDWNGVPVLVAGGLLGKAYALALKKRGAIAIDIGSVADKWMNKKTRPGF